MESSKVTLRESDWLKHHLQSSDTLFIDPPTKRRESTGRSRTAPIIVPGEEAPPLIVVESRDISPTARKRESINEVDSPRSENNVHHLNKRGDNSRRFFGTRSRTLSPQPRSWRSHGKTKRDDSFDAAVGAATILRQGASPVANTESKESAVYGDAVTTTHANRKNIRDCYNSPSNTNFSCDIQSRSVDRKDDRITNVASMTSSLTSLDSNEDRYGPTQYLPSTLRQHSALMKQKTPQSQQSKSLLSQTREKNGRYKLGNKNSVSEKQQNLSMDHNIKHSAKTDVFDYPSTPQKATATTPDIIYNVLNDDVPSSNQVGNDISPLSYNLSGVLRGSSSDTASFFHDFRNPNVALSPQQSTLYVSNLGKTAKHQKTTEKLCTEGTNLRVHGKSMERRYGVVDSDADEVVSSYSSRDDIANHSILQLCTEDLMSDDADRVNAALERLDEVCCFVGNKNTNQPVKTTSSVVSTLSASSSVLNRVRFIKAGGHALIVGVMKKFTSSAHIQAAACKLIRQFILMDEYSVQTSSNSTNERNSSNRTGHSGAFNELFSAVYGMDCVIGALQRFHPTQSNSDDLNGNVYNLACGALVAIVCSSFKMIDRLLQDDTRYLSIFLKAIHAPINTNSPGVNRVLYYVLKQFPQYINEIVIAGGIEEVVNEMKCFPDSMEVQYCGCAAIGTLLKKNSRMIMSSLSAQDAQKYGDQSVVGYIVNHLEGANVIVAALKAFPNNEDIQGKGVIALCNIIISAATTKANVTITSSIKKAGGLSAIGIALENFPNNQTIQDNGCLAIKSLLESSIMTATTK